MNKEHRSRTRTLPLRHVPAQVGSAADRTGPCGAAAVPPKGVSLGAACRHRRGLHSVGRLPAPAALRAAGRGLLFGRGRAGPGQQHGRVDTSWPTGSGQRAASASAPARPGCRRAWSVGPHAESTARRSSRMRARYSTRPPRRRPRRRRERSARSVCAATRDSPAQILPCPTADRTRPARRRGQRAGPTESVHRVIRGLTNFFLCSYEKLSNSSARSAF